MHWSKDLYLGWLIFPYWILDHLWFLCIDPSISVSVLHTTSSFVSRHNTTCDFWSCIFWQFLCWLVKRSFVSITLGESRHFIFRSGKYHCHSQWTWKVSNYKVFFLEHGKCHPHWKFKLDTGLLFSVEFDFVNFISIGHIFCKV